MNETAIIICFGLFLLVVLAGTIAHSRTSSSNRTKPLAPRPVEVRVDTLVEQWHTLNRQFGGQLSGESLRFERDGVEVEVAFLRTTMGETSFVRTELQLIGDFAAISLHPESVRSSNDIQTGDENFDGLARVSGDSATALAILTPEARRKLGRALMQGWVFEGGELRSTLHRKFDGAHLDGMATHINEGLVLARLVARPSDILGTLVSRLSSEPSLPGRLAVARHVPHAIRDHAAHRQALAALPDPEVRLLLATRLDHPDLWSTLPEPTLIPLIHHADERVAEAAITALARAGSVVAIPDLKRRTNVGGDLGRLAKDVALMIQSRLSGSRGDLALASESEGHLALVEPKASR